MAIQPSPPDRPSNAGRVRVGIGSWMDDEYVGVLYPEELPKKNRLTEYAARLDHAEVNATLYRSPTRANVESWMRETPTEFTFNVRLHRAFSDDPDAKAREGGLVTRFLDATQPLIEAKRLGAFLLVMPATFGPKHHRLEEFDVLAEKFAPHRIAVELRNRGWIDDEQREKTFEYFRARKLVWVAVDMPRLEDKSSVMPPLDEVTNPELAYLRLHGRNPEWTKAKTTGERHTYQYSEDELKEIAGRVRDLAGKAQQVHVVANNHVQDFAPKAALMLKRVLG